MPVVTFDYEDFIDLLGYEISKDELLEKLPMIGADLDRVNGNEIGIEFFPNRPDLASVEGIARASRAFFDFEKGIKKYSVEKSDVVLTVDESVKKVRPFIATALVKDVTMTDNLIKSLMELQEKLHMGLGRNRKKVAIGVHNFEAVQPPFVYKAVDPDTVQFIPLAKTDSWTMTEILEKHEKGQAFAQLLEDFDKHPIILDKNNNVLSYPPIINGILTEVTPFTKDIFLDVTGTDFSAVKYALNIVAAALAERGGQIYTTTVKDNGKEFVSPDFKTMENQISVSYVNKILGTEFKAEDVIGYLEKMGHQAEKNDDKTIMVETPAWRADILHDIDLVEDVAVGFGYNDFKTSLPQALTFGKTQKNQSYFDHIKNTLVGLGFNEVTTFTISNEKTEFESIGLEKTKRVEIKNPVGEEYTCLRVGLLPSLLNILNENRHHGLPQQIFELGIVVDEKFKNSYHLGFVKIDAKANFTECKSLAEAVLREMNLDYNIKNFDHPGFVKGRCASVTIGSDEIGFFGELHPRSIKNYDLEHPVIGFELNLGKSKKQ
jgi:phenylalanyl-tRNA synthetase beta chain